MIFISASNANAAEPPIISVWASCSVLNDSLNTPIWSILWFLIGGLQSEDLRLQFLNFRLKLIDVLIQSYYWHRIFDGS